MLYIHGGKVSLAANAEGTVTIEIKTNIEITRIAHGSDGRFEVQDIDLVGKEDIFDGYIDNKSMCVDGNSFQPPEPLALSKGNSVSFKLKDLSGSANNVYIMLLGRKV